MSSRPSPALSGGQRLRAVARHALVGASTLAVAVTLFSVPASLPAAADPAPNMATAKAQVERLEIEAAAIDEDSVAIKVELAAGTRRLARKQQDLTQHAAQVARLRIQVSQVALAHFQNGGLDTTAKLFLTSDPQGLLNTISTLDKVTENQQTVLRNYQTSQSRLVERKRSAEVDVAGLKAQARKLAGLRAASAAKMAQSKAVLARLTEEERRRLAAAEAAERAAARQAAEEAQARATDEAARARALASRRDSSSTSGSARRGDVEAGSSAASRTGGSSSGKGTVALAYAKRQLGKPYVWGATGPGSYDCSGLMLSAWREAGVSIPRVSRVQSTGAGRAIAKAELRPGDLVFFFSPVSHVAMYVGHGTVIHAPRPGKSVTYTTMSAMPYAGARRPS